MPAPPAGGLSAPESFPEANAVIKVHVEELRQLFNSIDPSPFRDRDLDPAAVEFIVGWARELPRHAALGLLLHLDRPVPETNELGMLRDAVQAFFSQRAVASRQRLRQLFRVGRTSLAIGICCLAGSIGIGSLMAGGFGDQPIEAILRESLLIGGWVAMWRPLEIFLYDWWPIRNEIILLERLASMKIRIVTGAGPLTGM